MRIGIFQNGKGKYMRFDLRAALHGALDVPVPAMDTDAIRVRSKRRLLDRARRSASRISAVGLIVACMAIVVAGSTVRIAHNDIAMRIAMPAPEPVST
jgi:hypothetical protein